LLGEKSNTLQFKTTTYRIGPHDYVIRSLSDRQQFWDPDGRADRAGISSASWPMFGVIWPAAVALAEEMDEYPIAGKSILEVGCGLGLASMVLQRRGADITASDYHPLAEDFLRYNCDLNGLAQVHFVIAPWAGPNPDLGRFDLIIGSDLLYEPDHPAMLAGFIARHANPKAQVIHIAPSRGYSGRLSKHLAEQGYTRSERSLNLEPESQKRQARMLIFTRK